MDKRNARYLIIGGAPRAGTTSLYQWLSMHPAVCPSSLKETRFFVDADYPLPAAHRFDGANICQYFRFFSHYSSLKQSLCVEATPDYLYTSTALRIADELPYSKIIFVLRDPVERMASWFKYAKQRGFLSSATTFREYLNLQCDLHITPSTPIHLRALDQGRYWKYIPNFERAFGDRLMLVNFDDLRSDPSSVMAGICDFANIDKTHVNPPDLIPNNASYQSRFPRIEGLYGRIRRRLADSLHDSPGVVRILRRPNQLVRAMLNAGKTKAADTQIDDDLVQVIYRQTCNYSSPSTNYGNYFQRPINQASDTCSNSVFVNE